VKARYGASDIVVVIACLQYYAGWADKIQGKTIEVTTTVYQYLPVTSMHALNVLIDQRK
jgi:hypothetical protein